MITAVPSCRTAQISRPWSGTDACWSVQVAWYCIPAIDTTDPKACSGAMSVLRSCVYVPFGRMLSSDAAITEAASDDGSTVPVTAYTKLFWLSPSSTSLSPWPKTCQPGSTGTCTPLPMVTRSPLGSGSSVGAGPSVGVTVEGSSVGDGSSVAPSRRTARARPCRSGSATGCRRRGPG